jgi:hypothetical protein
MSLLSDQEAGTPTCSTERSLTHLQLNVPTGHLRPPYQAAGKISKGLWHPLPDKCRWHVVAAGSGQRSKEPFNAIDAMTPDSGACLKEDGFADLWPDYDTVALFLVHDGAPAGIRLAN